MNLLMHTCCAPCSIACIDQLRGEGIEPVAFWFNPNIHPKLEYTSRKNALIEFAKDIGLELILHGDYGLREFIAEVCPNFDERCPYCYRSRMEETAKYAAENGFTHFTTTLLISPYQNHELLRSICEQTAAKYGVEFIYHDFRPKFREGQGAAREQGLYMQKYCGCIFSEEERYTKKRLNP